MHYILPWYWLWLCDLCLTQFTTYYVVFFLPALFIFNSLTSSIVRQWILVGLRLFMVTSLGDDGRTMSKYGATSTRRGRKSVALNSDSKLEKSRQSARECRSRKKLRYQYLEEMVDCRERAIYELRSELEMVSCSSILLPFANSEHLLLANAIWFYVLFYIWSLKLFLILFFFNYYSHFSINLITANHDNNGRLDFIWRQIYDILR